MKNIIRELNINELSAVSGGAALNYWRLQHDGSGGGFGFDGGPKREHFPREYQDRFREIERILQKTQRQKAIEDAKSICGDRGIKSFGYKGSSLGGSFGKKGAGLNSSGDEMNVECR